MESCSVGGPSIPGEKKSFHSGALSMPTRPRRRLAISASCVANISSTVAFSLATADCSVSTASRFERVEFSAATMAAIASRTCRRSTGGSSSSSAEDAVSCQSCRSSSSRCRTSSIALVCPRSVVSHLSRRSFDRNHAFCVSSMIDAGPPASMRRWVSWVRSAMCSRSRSKLSPIARSSSETSLPATASRTRGPTRAARSGISAIGIGVGSGVGVGAGVASGAPASCVRASWELSSNATAVAMTTTVRCTAGFFRCVISRVPSMISANSSLAAQDMAAHILRDAAS